jgi:hypothetical protein
MVMSVRYVTLWNISVANIQTFAVAKKTQRKRTRGKVLYLKDAVSYIHYNIHYKLYKVATRRLYKNCLSDGDN